MVTGGLAGSPRKAFTTLHAKSPQPHDYKELTRVENLIYDSCMLYEGEQEMQCLRVWDKLTKFHAHSSMECSLDNLRCIVLDVLDRLCAGIEGKDGLILLNKVSSSVLSFRDKFNDVDAFFDEARQDNEEGIDFDSFKASMRTVDKWISEEEMSLIFMAADADGDGHLARDELSAFLTAAIFAEEPLRALEVDGIPKKRPELEDLLRWSTSGRTTSWSGLARLR